VVDSHNQGSRDRGTSDEELPLVDTPGKEDSLEPAAVVAVEVERFDLEAPGELEVKTKFLVAVVEDKAHRLVGTEAHPMEWTAVNPSHARGKQTAHWLIGQIGLAGRVAVEVLLVVRSEKQRE
jgi:hypothetical protein